MINYDLTELLIASPKTPYYGIARVVAEIAFELAQKKAGVRFVVFSPGHRQFFEVQPQLDSVAADGFFSFGLPKQSAPIHIRSRFHKGSMLRAALWPLVEVGARLHNVRRWRTTAGAARPLPRLEGVLFSAARPKVILDYLPLVGASRGNLRLVPLLHDMIPLRDARGRLLASFTSNFFHDNVCVLRGAHSVIANSNFTASELNDLSDRRILPPLPPVHVVQLAHEIREGDRLPSLALPDEPYFLAVGQMIGRKNLECVFDAMIILASRGMAVPHLILAGAMRSTTRTFLEAQKYGPIRDKVKFWINPRQDELASLYRGAEGLVIASFIEGWGLPPGEALWVGTPALVSDIPALREVCGDLGLYFAPDRPEELAEHMARLLLDENYRSGLRARIAGEKKRLRTWETVADDLMTLLREIETPKADVPCAEA